MSLNIGYMVCGNQCVDYEITITDKQKLAEEIAELLLGHCSHMSDIIRQLDTTFPDADKASIEYAIAELEKRKDHNYIYKVDGWLLQMISWLALSKQHSTVPFYIYPPQMQLSMHGLDGLAITINQDNTIDKVIITEDKCTDSPRDTIREKVYPEFDLFENGAKNSTIYQLLASIVAKETFVGIQNDVRKKEHRAYRICITRENCHDSLSGRMQLFDDYSAHVNGDTIDRRTGASLNVGNLRNWMEDLCNMVKDVLIQKLANV